MGWQARQHQKYMPDTQAGLIAMTPDAAGYLAGGCVRVCVRCGIGEMVCVLEVCADCWWWAADADRFHTDVSGDERRRREEALRRREQATQFRREQVMRISLLRHVVRVG